MRIYLGSDHAGYELKEKLKIFLGGLNHEVIDKGAFEYNQKDDYPDFVSPVADAVAVDEGSFGIVLGASGEGEAIDANRVKGIRATEYYGGNLEIVKLGRAHNNANILSLGARFIGEGEAQDAVKLFLETPFEGGRHEVRIKKIDQ